MKNSKKILMGILAFAICSCNERPAGIDPWDDDSDRSGLEYDDTKENEENNQTSSSETVSTGSLKELESFDIAFDAAPLNEAADVPSDKDDPFYEDYVENYEAVNTVTVMWSGSSAEISGSAEGVEVSAEGGDVVIRSSAKGMRYVLSGSCPDGMVSIYSEKKFELDLEGLELANQDGPAVNIQSGKRVYVVLKDGTVSSLNDGSVYSSSDEDRKGTFFSEGQLCFSGKGTLDVTASYKHGIASDDYIFFRNGPVVNVKSSGSNGIKANDYIHIEGGVLNVEASSAGGKALSSDGYIRINGGRTTLMTTGGVDETDYSSSACVKTDSIFVIGGGELLCKSTGRGGKGIKVDMNAYFNGGTVRIITSGADYGQSGGMWGGSSANTARPKGIRVEGKLFINGGDIMVRTSSHEGIESKSHIEISGGRTMVRSYDDAVNSAGELVVNGGYLYAQGMNNDGLDSNGNMTFNGGTVVAAGPSSGAECGIDVNEEGRAYITMNGGTVIGVGAGNSTPEKGTQYSLVYGSTGMGGGPGGPGGGFGGTGGPGGGRPGQGGGSASIVAGTSYVVADQDGKPVVVFVSPVSGSGLFISSPDISKGVTYTLLSGASVDGGEEFCGLFTDASVSGGTSAGTATVSAIVTSF